MRCILVCAVVALGCGDIRAENAVRTPNIVFILADDLGYADLKCCGHPYARTPNLDRLASEGTRFTQFYVTGVTCCPSRTGFMTGKFPASFKEYPADFGFGKVRTVTELLKGQGYRTGHVGKWHIGPKQTAGTYGIDAINAEEMRRRQDPRGRDAAVFDGAIAFLEKNKKEPFYLNVWAHSTHFPVNPPRSFVESFKDITVKPGDFSKYMVERLEVVRKQKASVDTCMRNYLGDVLALDASVGRLLKKLDELDLRKNTIVVFSSDHGPSGPAVTDEAAEKKVLRLNMLGYAGGLRGGKHGMYEGGVRVPFLLRWSGVVAAGKVNRSAILSAVDWLPTLCSITGAKVDLRRLDGEDVSAVWKGKGQAREKPLFWKRNTERSEIGIRDGKWKLHLPYRRRGEVELYDLAEDAAESKNLTAKHPEVVKRLRTQIEQWNATLPKTYTKSTDKD